MSIHKIEPMMCGYDGCTFQCFELTTMAEHAKTHYPEAAANDEKARRLNYARGMSNVAYPDETMKVFCFHHNRQRDALRPCTISDPCDRR